MSSQSGAQHEAGNSPAYSLAGEWFRKAQCGDRAAYGQIVMAFQDRIYNALLRLVGNADEAGELTQETFTRGLIKIDSFRGEASPYTWLFRIGMNLAISQLRSAKRHRSFSLDGSDCGRDSWSDGDGQAASLRDRFASDRESSPPRQLEQRERQQQVLAALGRIDADHRTVLVMRDIEGFDYQQMAEVLELPVGTIKSRLFRARVALREELNSYLADRT